MEIVLGSNTNDKVNQNISLLVLGIFFALVLIFLYSVIGDKYLPIIFISLLPALIALAFNFKLSFGFLILSLFINIHAYWFSTAIWLAVLVPLSYLICFRNFNGKDFSLPVTFSLVVYLFTMIISLVNSIDPLFSIYFMYNMLAFIMIVYISASAISTKKEIMGYIILFLILNLLNSFHVLFEGLTSTKRAFGFAGIMFVDYVGIAITLNFILLLISKGKKYRIFLVPSFIIFVAALLVTQTRNAWISTFLCLFLVMIFIILNAKKIEMKKSSLIVVLAVSIFLISSLVLAVTSFDPEVTERAEQTTKVEESVDQSGKVQSSLLTRVMIWHTAYFAFLEHPVIGIGAYSFPFSSDQYYQLPRMLFEDYVKGKTPHVTFIAVAVETGLIGLFAFLFFLIATLKFSYDSIKHSKSIEDTSFSLLLFGPLIYITISMLMTDAWLWGQGIILWGILLGFNLWNRNRIFIKNINRDLDLIPSLNSSTQS
ncbi:MAG: O-antigen ligase family protein [Ignavibacteriaceae bacterium]|nr:O-antigen ligase family protein [Ignavibacteriaceae bacterium]MCW9065803.1 O-antigen ligase family protein [Ignavibacteriaceae bacterium]